MTDQLAMDPSKLNDSQPPPLPPPPESILDPAPSPHPPEDHLDNELDDDSDTPPTAEEWNHMKRYGSFITHDEQNEEHTFHLNDIIYVLPSGRNPDQDLDKNDFWLAQIKSIRAYNSHSVWIRAKWFYHPREVPKGTKGITAKLKDFGELERISSNQADFIPTSTCCGHASVVPYDEQDMDQTEIEDGTFYYRSEYDWQKQILTRSSRPCSICKKIYNPDTDTMHFCPRPDCRRTWHKQCLEKANWYIASDAPHFHQRIESLDKPVTTDSSIAAAPFPKKKRQRTTARASKGKNASTASAKTTTATITTPATVADDTIIEPEAYARIPPALLTVARQPIARGGALGIVGNVRSVTRARKMVQQALRGEVEVPEDWAEKLGTLWDVDLLGPSEEVKKRRKVVAYQCPQCGEPI